VGLLQLLRAPKAVWQATVTALPGPTGDALRHRYWKRRLGHLGARVRISEGAYFSNPGLIRIEDGSWIDRNVLVLAGTPRPGRITTVKANEPCPVKPGEVHIGANAHISPGCILSGLWGVSIGRDCGLAANVLVYSYSGHYRNSGDAADRRQFSYSPRSPDAEQAIIAGPVVIGDYCGIAPNAILLPGARLERGTWVAPGTVVRGKWGPQTLVSQGAAGLQEKELGGLKLP
jgi:acetyltransferase-like isoleucine patch superfamily enzyme